FAIPSPKIGTADGAAVGHARLDGVVDHAVVALPKAGIDARVVLLAVTREAEFLEDQRFVQGSSDAFVRFQILSDLRRARLPSSGQVFSVHPTPVEWPGVRGDIVDL